MGCRKAAALIVGAYCLTAASGCGSSMLTGSWTDPTYTGGQFKKVMIVAVAKREALRMIFETNFATQLRAHGVEGIPSRTALPGPEQLEKETLDAKLAELGCDGVLITRLIDTTTQTTYYPPTGYAVPVAYRSGYYHYYRGAYVLAYSPGYAVESTTASLETNLYDARTGNLVWTGLTDTMVSGDPEARAQELVTILVTELTTRQLIAK